MIQIGSKLRETSAPVNFLICTVCAPCFLKMKWIIIFRLYYSCTLKSIVEIHYTENKLKREKKSKLNVTGVKPLPLTQLICIRIACKIEDMKKRFQKQLFDLLKIFFCPAFFASITHIQFLNYWLLLNVNRISLESPSFSINQLKIHFTRNVRRLREQMKWKYSRERIFWRKNSIR